MKLTAMTEAQSAVMCQTATDTFLKKDRSSAHRKKAACLSELQVVTTRETEIQIQNIKLEKPKPNRH